MNTPPDELQVEITRLRATIAELREERDSQYRLLRSCECEISLMLARGDLAGEPENDRYLDLQARLLKALGFTKPSVSAPTVIGVSVREAAQWPLAARQPSSGREG